MVDRRGNPLRGGCSPDARSENIRELRGTGRPLPQAIAIAYSHQRQQGCKVPARRPNPVDDAVLNRELVAMPGRRWRAGAGVRVECDADGYCVVVDGPRGREVRHRTPNPVEAASKARMVNLVVAGHVNPNAPKTPDRQGKARANPVSPKVIARLDALAELRRQEEGAPRGRRGNPVDPYAVKLQAALLTPTPFQGRHVLEKLAQLPDPADLTDRYRMVRSATSFTEQEPWISYLAIRNRALAELRFRLGFPGAAEEVAEAQEAYIQNLYKRMKLRIAHSPAGYWPEAQPGSETEAHLLDELRTHPARRKYFQGHLDLALEYATRRTPGGMVAADKELALAIKRGPPDLAVLAERRARKRNPVDPAIRAARYQAAVLTPKAFQGRKFMQQHASEETPEGDVYLAKLRLRLGFKGAQEELVEAEEALAQHSLDPSKWLRSATDPSKWLSNYVFAPQYPPDYTSVHAQLTDEQMAERAEQALRLKAMPREKRVHWALQQDSARRALVKAGKPLPPELVSNLDLANDVAAQELIARSEKSRARSGFRHNHDPLATRETGHGERMMIKGRLLNILSGEARGTTIRYFSRPPLFRHAADDHDDVVVIVAPGEERVESSIEEMPARRGRKWFRRKSRHVWYVSRAILSPEVRALNARRGDTPLVYLRPDLRVAQGRGTSLKLERKTGARGAWS